MNKKTFLILAIALLSSCSSKENLVNTKKPEFCEENFQNKPFDLESIVMVSEQKVYFSSKSPNIIADLKEWLKENRPEYIEVTSDNIKVTELIKILNIPYKLAKKKSDKHDITLYYKEKELIDCSKNSFDFGCASSSNILKMLSN